MDLELDSETVTLCISTDFSPLVYVDSTADLIQILGLNKNHKGDAAVLLADMDNYVVTVFGPSQIIFTYLWDEDSEFINNLHEENIPFHNMLDQIPRNT